LGQYLSKKTDINGDRILVVHRIKLRGEPSFGLVVLPEPEMEVGQDVLYGEVYGQGIQAYTYGEKRLNFRAFDLLLDG
jgi:hypothetical protein